MIFFWTVKVNYSKTLINWNSFLACDGIEYFNFFVEFIVLDAPKSQCSSLSDGESFEGFGENYNQEGGIDLELAPHLNSTQIA